MRRNCNLELRLFPLYDSGHRHDHDHDQDHDHNHLTMEEAGESPIMQQFHNQHHQQHEQHQQLTIFYDGKICVSDVSELQARSIIMLANKKVEERVRTPSGSDPHSPTMQSHHQLYSPGPATGTGFSMKRSLQRFLQKRKNRIQEASPYNH